MAEHLVLAQAVGVRIPGGQPFIYLLHAKLLSVPELPDVEAYVHALKKKILGEPLEKIKVHTPFVLRTVRPEPAAFEGKTVRDVTRLGKRIVLRCDEELFIVIHLMIAGRLLWREEKSDSKRPLGKISMATFDFPNGSLLLTEASTKKRAGIYAAEGKEELQKLDPGGIEVIGSSLAEFSAALTAENRTLKRALTNSHWFSGIGNAFSDEILHAAKLSPLRQTKTLDVSEIERLHNAAIKTLLLWKEQLIKRFDEKFPGKGEITAFRPEFAVHGKFGVPCPVCKAKVQRIRYAENETNYCPKCQNEGRVLADRSLSRLLKSDWPRTVEEMEE